MADPFFNACGAEETSDGFGELSQNLVVLTRALAAYLVTSGPVEASR
jgi:hypothetical protein